MCTRSLVFGDSIPGPKRASLKGLSGSGKQESLSALGCTTNLGRKERTKFSRDAEMSASVAAWWRWRRRAARNSSEWSRNSSLRPLSEGSRTRAHRASLGLSSSA